MQDVGFEYRILPNISSTNITQCVKCFKYKSVFGRYSEVKSLFKPQGRNVFEGFELKHFALAHYI